MRDGEWELIYDAYQGYSSSSLRWGIDVPIFNGTTPVIGDPEFEVADAGRAREDGVDFGIDFLKGRTIAFDIGVTGDNPTDVRRNENRLSSAWRADAVRRRPGAVAALHAQYRGVERVAFGRPRRYTANMSEVTTNNLARVTADFVTTDSVWYSPGYQAQTVSIRGGTGGGFAAPFKSPITTGVESDYSTYVDVFSEIPAWPIITIYGGITNPRFRVNGLWEIRLLGTFAEDDVVTINTEPWARTVTNAAGVSLAGRIARDSTRLSKAFVPFGNYEIGLAGTADQNSVAYAEFKWRNAYTSL